MSTGEILFGAQYERIGVTSTREGLTWAQLDKLDRTLRLLKDFRGAAWLHHGDCVGGDVQAARLARDRGFKIVDHPPTRKGLRAFFHGDEAREPLDYLERNRALADEVDLLIGLPKDFAPRPRSGTWYTIGYAEGTDTKVAVILPDGSWRP
jgi:hypothetical protein